MQVQQLIAALAAPIACTTIAFAQNDVSSNWFRDPAISPDGKTVAFSYRGDLYRVDSGGGIVTRQRFANIDFPVVNDVTPFLFPFTTAPHNLRLGGGIFAQARF